MNRRRLATLVWTRRVGPNIFQQRFRERTIARGIRAGQFVHILASSEQLFRRAFSVYAADADDGTFDILYQVLGVGTRALGRLAVGAEVDTLGPLGNRFTPPPRGVTPILVGGGLGMAPLRLLALECCRVARQQSQPDQPVMILGARTRGLAVKPYQLPSRQTQTHWATDDGSLGFQGTVVALLDRLIERGRIDVARARVFGCGPEPMLAALASLCAEYRMPCEVSLERAMPCGYGVCMGCVVRGKNTSGYETYYRVCRNGPVFDAAKITF